MAKKEEKVIEMLKELVRYLAGRGSEDIIDQLFGHRDVNEFKLADKLGLTVNQARNILYKLLDAGIVSFTRKKEKRKGWYTYYWTLDTEKALNLLKQKKQEQIASFQRLLKSRQSKNFYECQEDGIEMAEETAMLHDFLCPECGQLLKLVPREKKVKEIISKIGFIKKSCSLIDHELETIKIKAAKAVKIKQKKKSKRK